MTQERMSGEIQYRVLFLCSRNRLRSPTAEQVIGAWPGVATDSAGLALDADTPLDEEQLHWATLVCLMEKIHKTRLLQRFPPAMKGKRIVVLNIPDNYAFMEPALGALIEAKMRAVLG